MRLLVFTLIQWPTKVWSLEDEKLHELTQRIWTWCRIFWDAGSVDLNGFSIVYQRVWERLAAIKGERVMQAWYSISPLTLSHSNSYIQMLYQTLSQHRHMKILNMYIYIYMCVCTYAYTYKHMHIYMNTYMGKYIHSWSFMHTYIHTYVHAYI